MEHVSGVLEDSKNIVNEIDFRTVSIHTPIYNYLPFSRYCIWKLIFWPTITNFAIYFNNMYVYRLFQHGLPLEVFLKAANGMI